MHFVEKEPIQKRKDFTDKLKSKKDQTADEKTKINELEVKINTRRKTFFIN